MHHLVLARWQEHLVDGREAAASAADRRVALATEAPGGPVGEAGSSPEDPGTSLLLAAGQGGRAYRSDLLLLEW